MDEAHVEHPVGLVEDEDLNLAQVDGLLPDVIEQPSRRCDQDVNASAQRIDLRVDADAAVDGDRLELNVLAVGADALLDLRAELAGRRDHQRPDRMPCRRMARIGFFNQFL